MNINTLMEEFDEKFLGCDYKDCAGQFCSQHQFKEYTAGRLPALFLAFLEESLSKTCDEILGAVKIDGYSDTHSGEFNANQNRPWNAARKAIESKVKEIKNL